MHAAARALLVGALFLLSPLATGCGEEEFVEPSPLPCSYGLSAATASFGSAGGAGSVGVTTEPHCVWSAASTAGWITIGAGATGTGPGTVEFVVAPNPGAAERVGTIAVADKVLAISQQGRVECAYDVSPARQSFSASGGLGAISVSTTPECTWTATTADPWIQIRTGAQGQGSGSVTYNVEANPDQTDRRGAIVVAGVTVAVEQSGAEPPPPPGVCEYRVAPTEYAFHWHGTSVDGAWVDVTTGATCQWTVTPGADWISLRTPSDMSGSGRIVFATPTYLEETTRRAPLQIRWPTPTAGQNVWITQEGCYYAVAPDAASFTAQGGRGEAFVFGTPVSQDCMIGCPWSAVSFVPWIRIVTGMPRAGETTFVYEVEPNVSGADRIGVIRIERATLTIRQTR